jgi:hypothetical protein
MYFIFEADGWKEVKKLASEKTTLAVEWLKQSGMVINKSKAMSSYFSLATQTIPLIYVIIVSIIHGSSSICILGILFDYKMSRDLHLDKVLKESKRSRQAIRHISIHLTKSEFLNVAPGLFFSKFDYGSSLWLTTSIQKSFLNRAKIHQVLLSQFSLLAEFFIGKVTVKY